MSRSANRHKIDYSTIRERWKAMHYGRETKNKELIIHLFIILAGAIAVLIMGLTW